MHEDQHHERLVDDQDKALAFYTDVLGFVKKTEIPLGEARWLTVVSPGAARRPELLLEPDSHPAAGPFKRRSSRTASRSPRSRSTTCTPEHERLRRWGCASPRSPSRWAR
jgi:catechol 2,3-dioxygenase-like lactoylglutathione lyase family enzyme